MGLSIHPGEASWSYSGFNEFRVRLAKEEGIALEEMEGFGAPWRGEEPGAVSWDTVRSFLKPLLNHSDCDGYLDSYECEEMLPRLRVICAKWETEMFGDVVLQYDVQQLRALIAGMEHSVDHGCAVVFG